MSFSSIQLNNPTISGWVQPNKKIVILDSNSMRARVMNRILCVAGQIELKSYLHEIPEQWDLLIVNYDDMSTIEKTLMHQQFANLLPLRKIIILSCHQPPFEHMQTTEVFSCNNFLTIRDEVNAQELLVTVQKMLSYGGNIFGLEKYFNWGSCFFSISIKNSSERESIWNVAADFAAKTGIPSRMQNMFCTVVDELTTNALYNAPIDSFGKSKFSFLPRTVEISLDAAISITFSCDGRALGIAVSDPFGSLTSTTVTSYLARCSQKKSSQIVQQSGGAGLGLYSVFESLSHLVVNINKNIQTEVIGLLDIRGTYKDFVSQGKSLNIFEV